MDHDDISSLAQHIEDHLSFLREALAEDNGVKVADQAVEIEGWARAIAEAASGGATPRPMARGPIQARHPELLENCKSGCTFHASGGDLEKPCAKFIDDATAAVRVNDLREGTGTHHPRVLVKEIKGDEARCAFPRSGNQKWIKLTTLRRAYRLIERDHGAAT
jgi:hypothetical protein